MSLKQRKFNPDTLDFLYLLVQNSHVQICLMPHYNAPNQPILIFFHIQFHLFLPSQDVLKQLSKMKNIFQPPVYK